MIIVILGDRTFGGNCANYIFVLSSDLGLLCICFSLLFSTNPVYEILYMWEYHILYKVIFMQSKHSTTCHIIMASLYILILSGFTLKQLTSAPYVPVRMQKRKMRSDLSMNRCHKCLKLLISVVMTELISFCWPITHIYLDGYYHTVLCMKSILLVNFLCIYEFVAVTLSCI